MTSQNDFSATDHICWIKSDATVSNGHRLERYHRIDYGRRTPPGHEYYEACFAKDCPKEHVLLPYFAPQSQEDRK